MLLTQRAYAEGCRAMGLYVGMQRTWRSMREISGRGVLASCLHLWLKRFNRSRVECAVLGQQVLGGHGYIKEWGMEQIVRDARIGQIYEGANGVQAIDLVGRKIMRDGGKTLQDLLGDITATTVAPEFVEPLADVCQRLDAVTQSVVARAQQDPNLPGAVSVDFLISLGSRCVPGCGRVWPAESRRMNLAMPNVQPLDTFLPGYCPRPWSRAKHQGRVCCGYGDARDAILGSRKDPGMGG